MPDTIARISANNLGAHRRTTKDMTHGSIRWEAEVNNITVSGICELPESG